jgi:hypothetical protein
MFVEDDYVAVVTSGKTVVRGRHELVAAVHMTRS